MVGASSSLISQHYGLKPQQQQNGTKLLNLQLPMTGREDELRRLQTALQHIIQNEHNNASSCTITRTVLIEGVSGIGKSTLLQAFAEKQEKEINNNDNNNDIILVQSKFEETSQQGDPFAVLGDLLNQCVLKRNHYAEQQVMLRMASEIKVLQTLSTALRELLMRHEIAVNRSRDTSTDDADDDVNADADNIKNEEEDDDDDDSEEEKIASSSLQALVTTGRSRYGFQRVKLAWKTFWQNITSSYSSRKTIVVMLVDDLQWADAACLQLFQALLNEPDIARILFIGTRRIAVQKQQQQHTDHVRLEESFLRTIPPERLVRMRLSALSQEACLSLLQTLLQRNRQALLPLANVLLAKTAGNAFAVQQFLRHATERKLIYYNLRLYQWEWNLPALQRDTDLSDNLVQVVLDNLQGLPARVQGVLQMASLIGATRFDLTLLTRVVSLNLLPALQNLRNNKTKIVTCLKKAQLDGLVEPIDQNHESWKFAHDRIREGAYGQLSSDLLPELHLAVGRCFMRTVQLEQQQQQQQQQQRHTKDDSLDSLVLLAARHVNMGLCLLTNEEDRIVVAELNVRASELAFAKAAIFPAAAYLRSARQLSMAPWWTSNNTQLYALMLKITSTLSYLEYCSGHFEESDRLVSEVIANAKTLQEQLSVYRVRVMNYSQRSHREAAIDTCIQVLGMLGIKMPRRNLKLRLALQAVRTLKRLRGYSRERILEFQNKTDRQSRQIIDWLFIMTETSIQQSAFRYHQLLAGLCCVNVILDRELADEVYHVAGHAASLMAHVGDFPSAQRWEALAYESINSTTLPEHAVGGRLALLNLVTHTHTPFANCVKPSFDLLNLAIEEGFVEYFFYGVTAYMFTYAMAGFRLEPLEKDISRLLDIMRDFGQSHFISLCSPQMQFILNMMGKSGHPMVLTGTVMNEEDYRESSNPKARAHYYQKKMLLAFYFEEIEQANRFCSELPPAAEDGSRCWFAQRAFFEGLVAFSMAKRKKRSKYEKRGVQRIQSMEKWAKLGNMNCNHYLLILLAEHSTLKSSSAQVRQAFDKAIVFCSKTGLSNDRALANELAARYFLDHDEHLACQYLTRAVEAYSAWGARAKVDHLMGKYEDLVETSIEELDSTDYGTAIGAKSRADELVSNPRKVLTESKGTVFPSVRNLLDTRS